MTTEVLNQEKILQDDVGDNRENRQFVDGNGKNNDLIGKRIASLPITGPSFRPRLNLNLKASSISPKVPPGQGSIKIPDLSKFNLPNPIVKVQSTSERNTGSGDRVSNGESSTGVMSPILPEDDDYNSMLDDVFSDDPSSPRSNRSKPKSVTLKLNTKSSSNSVTNPESIPLKRPSSPKISVPIEINGIVRNELSESSDDQPDNKNGESAESKSMTVEEILNKKSTSVSDDFDHFSPKVKPIKSNRRRPVSLPIRAKSPPITKNPVKPRKLNIPPLVLNPNLNQKSLDNVPKIHKVDRTFTPKSIPRIKTPVHINEEENDENIIDEENEDEEITVIRMTRINGQGKQEYYYVNQETGEEIELSADQIPEDSDVESDVEELEQNAAEPESEPIYDKSSMFYQMNEIPNYQAMTPTDRARIRADFITKFGILRKAFPEFQIPALNPDDSLEVIHIQYKRYISQIHIENAADKWKIFLVIGWVVLELGGVKGLGLNLTGYTMAQITMMNKYQQLLIELGEMEQLDIGGDWPVYVRLIALSLFNGCVFLATRYLGKFLGPAAGQAVQMVLGVVSGEDPKPQEGQASGSSEPKPGPEALPEKQSKGAGLAGLVGNFMPMISNFLGGNKGEDSDGKPKRRRPKFDE